MSNLRTISSSPALRPFGVVGTEATSVYGAGKYGAGSYGFSGAILPFDPSEPVLALFATGEIADLGEGYGLSGWGLYGWGGPIPQLEHIATNTLLETLNSSLLATIHGYGVGRYNAGDYGIGTGSSMSVFDATSPRLAGVQ